VNGPSARPEPSNAPVTWASRPSAAQVGYHAPVPSLQEITAGLTQAAAVTGPWAPALLFLATFIEHVFPPFPGDLLVVLGAWYAVQGQLSWPMVLAFTTAGAVVGGWIDYRIGVAVGKKLEERAEASRWLTTERLAAFDIAYRRWGSWLLVLNRFMPGVRAFLFLAAGAAGLPERRVVLLGGLSAVLWNALLLAAGGLVAHNLDELIALVDRYMRAAATGLGVVVLLLLASAARRWAARRRRRA
jgi:membrane protein DedA with SNARE-associated domain